ncbi:MAG: prepilin peptidase [Moorellales bacterium]
MAVWLGAVAFGYGSLLGSFAELAAARILRGESVVRPRSRCDSCGHPLGLRDLVPVLSWLLLRGKCRWCGAGIPARHLWVELACGAAAAAAALAALR